MPSPLAEKAIADAQMQDTAILKFVSANDAGVTGSHQAGFYLPVSAWKLYAPFGPMKDRLDKSKVKIVWQGGAYETESVVTWYGQKTRNEYRLTCFGRGFPYLNDDTVGDLLIIIPRDLHHFMAYIIDLPEDIEDIQAALGVETIGAWAVYDAAHEPKPVSEDDCIDQRFRAFALNLAAFPPGNAFSGTAREALLACVRDFQTKPADDRLMLLMQHEYRLFKLVERQLCLPDVRRLFKDVDDFLRTASTLMNRRKSRAGRSFENHVEYLLKESEIPFDVRPAIAGEPDIIIPSKIAYDDPEYPTDKLFMLGVKTTCKDRWRQVLQEAPRLQWKHLITMQEGISATQLADIKDHKIALIVPRKLHGRYPPVKGVHLLDVDGFIKMVRKYLG